MEHFPGSFPYRNLGINQSQIRLVSIEPGEGDDPIRCQLQHAEFHDDPDYEALSYVWGSSDAAATIRLNEIDFPVTANLGEALWYLGKQDKSRTMWIDAVCINQKDVTERNCQVKRMGETYQRASKVVIWVGPDIPDTPGNETMPADRIFSYLYEQLYGRTLSGNQSEGIPSTPYKWTISLVRFVMRLWFRRMWIIQESVSHTMAEIVCGYASLPWRVFLFGLEKSIPAMQLPIHAADLINMVMSNVKTLKACLFLYYEWKGKRLDRSQVAAYLARILFTLSGTFHCTDPRDRLFAILGLIPGAASTLRSVGLDIAYDRLASEIFRDLAVFLITERSSIDILAAYGRDRSELEEPAFEGMPSWVPTWTENPFSTIPELLLERLVNREDHDYLPAQFKFSGDKNTLFLRGAVLGEVATIAEEYTADVLQLARSDVSFWKEIFQSRERAILNSPSIATRYMKTEDARVEWKRALFHPEEDDGMRAQHLCYDIITGHYDVSDFTQERREAYMREVWKFTSFIHFALTNKWPFVTSLGDICIAEGVQSLETGDLVCLFPGGTVPFILRSLDEGFEFIGACYIPRLVETDKQFEFLRDKELVEFTLI